MRVLLAAVLLVVAGCSVGSESKVAVPKVAMSHSVTYAYNVLHRAGLEVEIREPFRLSSLREPTVRTQSPRGGTRVERGSTVRLEVWGGPIGSAVGHRSPSTVPDAVGKTLTDAVTAIQEARLYFEVDGEINLPASDRPHLLDAYRVTDQRPEAGTRFLTGVLVGRAFRVTPVMLSVEPR